MPLNSVCAQLGTVVCHARTVTLDTQGLEGACTLDCASHVTAMDIQMNVTQILAFVGYAFVS